MNRHWRGLFNPFRRSSTFKDSLFLTKYLILDLSSSVVSMFSVSDCVLSAVVEELGFGVEV